MINTNGTDNTSQMEPILCVNGCGFYGNPQTANCCSRCFKLKIEKSNFQRVMPAVSEIPDPPKSHTIEIVQDPHHPPSPMVAPAKQTTNRCWECNKKLSLTAIKCRCGYVFCSTHRHAEQHTCTFDYKEKGRVQITQNNPLVVQQKLDHI